MNTVDTIEKAKHYRAEPVRGDENKWEAVSVADIEPGDVIVMSAYADQAHAAMENDATENIDWSLLWETREVVESTRVRNDQRHEFVTYEPRRSNLCQFIIARGTRVAGLRFTGAVEIEN